MIKNFKDYLDGLNEGLIKTYDGEKAITKLVELLQLLKFNANGSYNGTHITLEILDFNLIQKNQIRNLFDLLTANMINLYGWFPSMVELQYLNKRKISRQYDEEFLILRQMELSGIKIKFESKYDEIEPNVPDKLYHLSIKEYQNKILSYGLQPRSKSKLTSHIDRIYLCKTLDDCKLLAPTMNVFYAEEKDINLYTLGNKKWKKDTELIYFEIDNSDQNIVLYKDPNFVNGFYTLSNIPPKNIKLL